MSVPCRAFCAMRCAIPRPTRRLCATITPVAATWKLLGHLQRAETGGLEGIEGLVKFTVGWHKDDQAVSTSGRHSPNERLQDLGGRASGEFVVS